ncbi:GNAT family N-acetyltransferase [Actinophytocola algeriensis]|uniref:GNAT superfamily N-acetyltransferase n=1 Tax=Actinophytocola algeriensis TaxID=1768010 RepID=A0A7W7Q5N5_9PSEU|nr:GNAT family N-acetyltransferase [Actinophytocola algeriensis]MBB4907196.1 GNAT superfamily N-acetyltransferase [Actinophytocola algeriensis]MBE1478679.1 GNAT superfamily N-acetyltransferase [Actinophytocola algeriensis]
MDQAAALAAFDAQLRNVVRPTLDGGQFERVGPVIRCVSSAPDGWSGVEWSDVDETTADAVIAEQVRFFTEARRDFEWKYYAYDKPADLPERLLKAGLLPGEEEALMVADVADVPDVATPDGIRLVTVSDEDGLQQVKAVHDRVFGGDHTAMIDSMRERLPSGAVAPVLALAGDEAVCAARVDFHIGTDFASLWGGGTLPEWRGRGIYRALVSHRTKLAVGRGYRYLRTDALPTSRPILEKLGFTRLTTTVPYTLP